VGGAAVAVAVVHPGAVSSPVGSFREEPEAVEGTGSVRSTRRRSGHVA
jgi:hypothetical protein